MTHKLTQKLAAFVPTEIGVEDDAIDKSLRQVIAKLVKAGQIIDRLFLTQVSKENLELRSKLLSSGDEETLAYFDIMYGPWDRMDKMRPFIGSKPKPPGATFYPTVLTEEAFRRWITDHPNDREAFESYFTVIETHNGNLVAKPYCDAYRAHLAPAANALRVAATHATDPRLASYLTSRAKAFGDNAYRDSDINWMDLGDGVLEVVIGPYEVYEDELLGLKASFEAIVALRNPKDSEHLAAIKSLIPKMEAHLPIPDKYKNPNRGTDSPISVVDVLYTAGDTRAGVQTMAFNLPNDEVVREQKGSKKVLFKNVAHAKFDAVLCPIAERLIRTSQLKEVTFEAFFNHTLLHETAHGLGPGRIMVKGPGGEAVQTTVNQALKAHYVAIEEAKADVLGMYLNYILIDEGFHDPSFEWQIYATFLAGFFRSVRFGATEAHGQANVIQFNYLIEKGAINMDGDGRFGYVPDKMRDTVTALAHDLLMIEAEGDAKEAARFIQTYGIPSSNLAMAVGRLTGIPTDIRPIYDIEQRTAAWFPSWIP